MQSGERMPRQITASGNAALENPGGAVGVGFPGPTDVTRGEFRFNVL